MMNAERFHGSQDVFTPSLKVGSGMISLSANRLISSLYVDHGRDDPPRPFRRAFDTRGGKDGKGGTTWADNSMEEGRGGRKGGKDDTSELLEQSHREVLATMSHQTMEGVGRHGKGGNSALLEHSHHQSDLFNSVTSRMKGGVLLAMNNGLCELSCEMYRDAQRTLRLQQELEASQGSLSELREEMANANSATLRARVLTRMAQNEAATLRAELTEVKAQLKMVVRVGSWDDEPMRDSQSGASRRSSSWS